jgi:hypothetical protein
VRLVVLVLLVFLGLLEFLGLRGDPADQPWRCLWRRFSQITMTRPWRRITLHLSQIFLTLGWTFTAAVLLGLRHTQQEAVAASRRRAGAYYL